MCLIHRRFQRYAMSMAAFALATSLAGCSEDSSARTPRSNAEKFTIVCTTGMVTDLVSHIAGDQATVVGLMGEGVDPHLYQPTFDDVARLVDADIVFYNGLVLEGSMQTTFEKLASRKPVHAVSADIAPSELRTPAEFEGHPDPHIWNDPPLWMTAARTVARRLSDFDPDNAAIYEQNLQKYLEELENLDAYVTRVLASIPPDQRVLVTAHDAFGYLGRRYQIDVKSVQGITTDSEPGVSDINQLVDFLVTHRVPAIFVETSVNQANIRAVLEGAASKGHPVQIGGTLFSDAMGGAGQYEGTYLGMIDHNATVITRALGGEAPVRGLHGRLESHDSEPQSD